MPMTGCHPRKLKLGENRELFPVLGEDVAFDLLPRNKWIRTGLSGRIYHVFNQSSTSSCTANAAGQGVMTVREIQGEPQVVLSPASLYKRINGGRDAGSAIDDALTELSKWGILPLEVFSANGWRDRYPDNADEIAKEFRVIEWTDVPDYEHAGSILSAGFPLVVGVDWQGGGGHAICLLEVDSDGVIFVNSWGDDYGDNGKGKLPERQVSRGIDKYGCWAPRVAVAKP